MIPMNRILLLAVPLLCLSTAGAETVYKSIDAQGNVTYSASPPSPRSGEIVETVPIAPPPSEEQQKAAEERVRQLEIESARGDREREKLEKEQTESLSAAEKELQEARAALRDAKIQGDDDWQYLAAGGRVLKQSYLDRVAKAEQRVREAEEAMRRARVSKP
jgi:hypothetical protein